MLLRHALLGMSNYTLRRALLPLRCDDGLYQPIAAIGGDVTEKAAKGAVCRTTLGRQNLTFPTKIWLND